MLRGNTLQERWDNYSSQSSGHGLNEWQKYGVNGQARIDKLASDTAALQDRDLNQEARMREAGRLRIEALEDLTLMADAAINRLRQEVARREDRLQRAIARADAKLDYSRISFHAQRLQSIVAGARDLGTIEGEIRRLAREGLPEERRAAGAVLGSAIMARYSSSGMQSLMEARQLAGQVPEMVPEDDTVRAQREAVEEMVGGGLQLKEAIRGWYKRLTNSIDTPSGPLGTQYQRVQIEYPSSANNWGQGIRIDADLAVDQPGRGWQGTTIQYSENGHEVPAE